MARAFRLLNHTIAPYFECRKANIPPVCRVPRTLTNSESRKGDYWSTSGIKCSHGVPGVAKVDIKETIRRWQVGEGYYRVGSATGLSRNTVRKYLAE